MSQHTEKLNQHAEKFKQIYKSEVGILFSFMYVIEEQFLCIIHHFVFEDYCDPLGNGAPIYHHEVEKLI